MPPTDLAVLGQPVLHARTAIGLAAFPLRLFDQRQPGRIGWGAGTGQTPRPRMIAAARDGQRRAQLVNGVFVTHGLYAFKTLAGAGIADNFRDPAKAGAWCKRGVHDERIIA